MAPKAKPAAKKSSAATGGGSDEKMLDNALGQIEKAFGKGSIMKLSDSSMQNIAGISTGALSLDIALGGHGFPRGRIIELFGPESSGKTTLALHAVGCARKRAASRPSSTPSMPSIPPGPNASGSTWRTCWSASPVMAKKACASPKC